MKTRTLDRSEYRSAFSVKSRLDGKGRVMIRLHLHLYIVNVSWPILNQNANLYLLANNTNINAFIKMNNFTHQSIKTQLTIASFTKIKENHVLYNMNDFLWASLGCLGSFRSSGFYTSSLNLGNNLCLSIIVMGGVQCSHIFKTIKR